MELILVGLMLVGGVGLALLFLIVVVGMMRAESAPRSRAASRGEIATSILHHIAGEGGAGRDRAVELVHRHSLHRGAVEAGIDLRSWSEAFARSASETERQQLLETAVRIAVAMHPAIPLAQYNALTELSFSLGFHPDALARLRARYRFDHVDYARASRPRHADRAGGAAPLFRRAGEGERQACLAVLGLAVPADRPQIISAYRRLAAQHHPDRFHGAPPNEQERAALRFIEITAAYERLLTIEDPEPDPGG